MNNEQQAQNALSKLAEMPLSDNQRKALAIAQRITDATFGINRTMAKPVNNARLLQKRAFPNRNMPHRVKRRLKDHARMEQAVKMAMAISRAAQAAMSIGILRAMPSPEFMRGGMPIIGETGPELILTPKRYEP